jgi:hypothetical protein
MKALISPQENNRICEVTDNDFPIAEPLFWANCPDDCTTEWTYDKNIFSPPVPYVQSVEERIAELKQLLADTDYVALSDYDQDKPEVKAQRQLWRDEIRELEA